MQAKDHPILGLALLGMLLLVLVNGCGRPGAEPQISRENAKDHRIYICFRGDIEFTVDGETFRMTTGDVLHVDKGETYGFHNGGYEEGRLLLIRVPGPATAGSAQP